MLLKACSFFGHRDCSALIENELKSTLIELIKNDKVNVFYVGNQGGFDLLVHNVLYELKDKYPFINCFIVLAYMPTKNTEYKIQTILPEGIENVHPKYALSWRNKWMIKQSDYVVTYIKHSFGGAAKFSDLAITQGKNVINLAK